MREIALANLSEKLKHFEAADNAKHVVIILTIKNFIQRFERFPELESRAKLFELSEDFGIFFMSVS